MRFGSICSGIEAASVAWHPLGWEAAWLAEVDVAASAVLAQRLGATAPFYPLPGSEKAIKKISWRDRLTNWGDMTRLPDLVRSGEAEAPDVLCGGTPCQAFSVAGRREGLQDFRGQLTLSFVDLADAIDERRAARGDEPCVVFWENVPGVLSSKDNAFGCFLGALAGESVPLVPAGGKWTNAGVVLGPQRAVAWIVKDAQYFGLAQRRARVFVVASAREGFDPAAVLFEFDGVRRDSAPSRETWQDVAGATVQRASGRGSHWDGDENPHPSLNQCHNTGGVGSSNQELFSQRGAYLVPGERPGSSRVTWPADLAPTLNAHFGEKQGLEDQHINGGAGLFVPAPAFGVALRGREGGATAELGDDVAGTPRASGGGGDKPNVLCFDTTQLTSPSNYSNPQPGDPCHPLAAGAHPPAICIHGTQDPIIGVDRAHALGRNGGQENVVCVTGNITHTLRAEGFDASEDGTGRGQSIVPWSIMPMNSGKDFKARVTDISQPLMAGGPVGGNQGGDYLQVGDMAVRRLMPVECERLQGFPDGWTDVPIGNKGAADGPRYKQLGNSWAVPCVRWIGERIVTHIAELDAVTIEAHVDDALLAWVTAA